MILKCTLPRFDDDDEPIWDDEDKEPVLEGSNLLPKFDANDEPYWELEDDE